MPQGHIVKTSKEGVVETTRKQAPLRKYVLDVPVKRSVPCRVCDIMVRALFNAQATSSPGEIL